MGARGLPKHLVVIVPGARSEPHSHRGYDAGIVVLEGSVETRYGARLESSVISEAGDFLFILPARALVSRNDPAEQDNAALTRLPVPRESLAA